MQQVHDPRQRRLTFVKFGDPAQVEIYRYDAEWIYHVEDRTDGSEAGYRLTDGRWLRRRMRTGETIEAHDNELLRQRPDCGIDLRAPFAYVMSLEARNESYPCGGDIGTADVIVLRYDPTWSQVDRRGSYELFYYARGWGWFKWQAIHFAGGELHGEAVFNRLGGPRVVPARSCTT